MCHFEVQDVPLNVEPITTASQLPGNELVTMQNIAVAT
jgi:hypothetical protein